MKKIILVALLILSITLSTTASRTALIFANEDNKEIVKVGYVKNYAIINDPFTRGSEGYGYEYLTEISRHSNLRFEFVEVEWDEGLEKIENGELDLFGPIVQTDDFSSRFEFTENEILYEEVFLLEDEDSSEYYESAEDYEDVRIGVLKNSGQPELLEKFIKEKNISPKIITIEHNSISKDMAQGLYVLRVGTTLDDTEGLKVVEFLGKTPLYFVSQKGNDELLTEIDEAIEEIDEVHYLFAEKLFLKYYSNSLGLFEGHAQTADHREAYNKDVYNVSYNSWHQPFSYTDSNGNAKGVSIDVMNELARIMGIEVKYILHDSEEYSNADIDFDVCSIGNESAMHNQISDPYMTLEMMAIMSQDLKKDDVKTIGTLNYNAIDVGVFKSNFPNAKIITVNNMEELYFGFKKEDFDVMVASDLVINNVLSQLNGNNYQVISLGYTLPSYIALSDDLPIEMLDNINQAILELDNGFVDVVLAENFSTFTDSSFTNILIMYATEFVVVLVILSCFLIAIFSVLAYRKRKEIRIIEDVDSVTGLMTKKKFVEEAEKILKNAKPGEYIMLSVDIDNFKGINTNCSYESGNLALIELSKVICERTRSSDLACRYNADIFLVLLKIQPGREITKESIDSEDMVSNSIYNVIGNKVAVNFSRGLYLIKNPKEDIDYIIDCANTARVKGKHIFGNTTFFYDEEMHNQRLKYNEIINTMKTALENEEIYIVVQPKYNLITGKIVGAEALARWKKPDGKMIYPDEFIPVFESSGFIMNLDYYILEKVCQMIITHKLDIPLISVNISAITAIETKNTDACLEILNKYEIDPERIELELTESVLDVTFDEIAASIIKFEKQGFHISIDDFGKGSSTLARIKMLDVDTIKIDKDFVQGNSENEKGLLILRSIVTLANDLDFTVVAEGIETKEHANNLIEMGCIYGQGYYYSKPLMVDEFIDLLKSNTSENVIDG